MRTCRIAGVVVLLLVPALVGRAQQVVPPDDQVWTTTVRGTVVRSDTRQPVAGVPVSVDALGDPPAITDAEGRFSFERIRPGRYSVYTYAEGFVPGVTGYLVRLTIADPRAPDEIQVVLTPFASITGTVRDPSGRPLASATVELRRLVRELGRSRMRTAVVRSRTDDRGRYQLVGVAPGEYFVRAQPPRQEGSRSGEWTRTYFPSAVDPAAATPIRVTAGADLENRDVTLQAVATYSVSGIVENRLPDEQRRTFDGRMALPHSFWVLRVDMSVEDDGELHENLRLRQPSADLPLEPAVNHAFELHGTPAGVYDLYPIIRGVLQPADLAYGVHAYTGRTRVAVIDRDITGVQAVVRRGHDVRLREVSGGGPPDIPATDPLAVRRFLSRRLWLAPREPIMELASRETGPGVFPDDTGTFVVPNVTDGRYDVMVDADYPIPGGEYLADVRQNGRSVIESGVTITEDPPGVIEVVFEPGAGTVEGTIRVRPGEDAFNQTVLLLPLEPGRRRALRTARSNAAGEYTVTNVAPGAYVAVACGPCAGALADLDLVVLGTRTQAVTMTRSARLTVPPIEVIDLTQAPQTAR